ncbi:VacJ family lipoprotein [Janthinobacterium sp. 17J80-10]|uniref:MlaA family lipoprotein n=1 Tax=Janthinobacterium sp. 17J80-10 TaxID=2497863 RepID=UPI001005A5BA|nr:VacJ family lipoprotein [Janthinobacterium sp. 17J80-10]QAU35834.1 VacJ family lipoprotein [Janthinobacterium sp. 17J80-10]
MNGLTRSIAAIALVFAVTGCASPGNAHDPLEGFNRAMFDFNDTLDRAALKPAAQAYQAVLPDFVQAGVGNFFGNLGDVWTAVNNFLQGKIEAGAQDVVRVVANSTLGVLGLFDIASDSGVPKHKEDFGQTLGVWGVPAGPYVVLPFLGASTVRDTVALPADIYGDIWTYKDPVHWRNTGSVVRLVDRRAALLDASNLLEDAALDRYQFVRDAYMQRRLNQVYDGDPPDNGNNGKDSQD